MESNWKQFIAQVQQGDRAAEGDLFHLVKRCVRPVALRRVGPVDADDSVHDVFIIVLNALRSQKLREPERLCAYIAAVFKFQRWRRWQIALATVDKPVESLDLQGGQKTPELLLHETENRKLVKRALSSCSERDRNILMRFYVDEQEREQICREMDLTPTQFRLLKSRAKDRFARIGRRLAAGPSAASPAEGLSVRRLNCLISTGANIDHTQHLSPAAGFPNG